MNKNMKDIQSGSIDTILALEQERLKKALNGEILAGETATGYFYRKGTKEECKQEILNLHDSIVKRLKEALMASSAYEKCFYHADSNGKISFKEFCKVLDTERKADTYSYHTDISDLSSDDGTI